MKKFIIAIFNCLSLSALASLPIENNVYKIHVMDFYPSHYRDKNGKIVGREVEKIESAFEAVGKKVEFVIVPINRCLQMLEQGSVNICATLAVTSHNQYHNIAFHKIALNDKKSNTFFIKSSRNHSEYNLNKLEKIKVSVFNLPEYVDELKKRGASVDLSRDDNYVIKKLLNNRVELGVIHKSTYLFLKKEIQANIKKIGDFLELSGFVGFSLSYKERQKVMDELDKGLRVINKNGKMEAINRKWNSISNNIK